MELVPNKKYTIAKKIKIHTKPLTEVLVEQTGIFIKQTDAYYIFLGFRVRKACTVLIKEVNI